VAEVFTGMPGKFVDIADTIKGFKEIVEGKHDNVPEAAFYMVGTIEEALEKAKSVNNEGFAGYKDWRVPTVKELASIVERQCIRPAINLTLFPNTPSDIFWTSEPYSDRTRHAWYFNLSHGYHDWSFNKDSLYSVRLVRGRQW
jgi:hypothetical protein